MLVGLAFIIGGSVGNTARGTSASGTSIPISKGGTSATTATQALQNLLPTGGADGKVLGLNGGAPSWVDQPEPKNSYMTPDYANMETTVNRITSGSWEQNSLTDFTFRSVSWEVTKTGYVSMLLDWNNITGDGWVDIAFFVNGKVYSQTGGLRAVYIKRETIPVEKGDTVYMRTSANTQIDASPRNISCYFIPPRYSTPPQPVVVESGGGGSYMTDGTEIKTADSWDGKPIYKQTRPITLTGALSAAGQDTGIVIPANLAKIIRSEVITNPSSSVAQGTVTAIVYTNPGYANFWIAGSSAGSGDRGFYVTVYYTKTAG